MLFTRWSLRNIFYLSWPIAPSYMSPNGEGGICAANECSCAHGAQINFGDPTPYSTYGPISYWGGGADVMLGKGRAYCTWCCPCGGLVQRSLDFQGRPTGQLGKPRFLKVAVVIINRPSVCGPARVGTHWSGTLRTWDSSIREKMTRGTSSWHHFLLKILYYSTDIHMWLGTCICVNSWLTELLIGFPRKTESPLLSDKNWQ
jgi:hypothetical protein